MIRKELIVLVCVCTMIFSCSEKKHESENLNDNSFMFNYNHFYRDSISSVYFRLGNDGLLNDTLFFVNNKGLIIRGQFWKKGVLIEDNLSPLKYKSNLDTSLDVYRYKSICLFFDSIKKVKLDPKELYSGDTSILEIYNLPDIYALVMPRSYVSHYRDNKFKIVSSLSETNKTLWYQFWYLYVDYKSKIDTISRPSPVDSH